MADFSTTVDVRPSASSLRDTEQTIQDEIGSLTVDVEPAAGGGVGPGGGSLSSGLAAGGLAGTTDLLSESVDLATERNTLLHEIRDFAERGALGGGDGGGGGGGILDTLLPVGVLSSLAGGSLLSGGLAISASSVLSVTGTLGLAAAGVLAVTGHLGLNATNVLAVTGTLGITATSALAFSGSLALSATGVLAVTGVLGLGAASVLAVSGALGLDVSNVLGVTGSLGLSAAGVLAVTGALSLPAAGVLAVTGTLSLAAGDVLDLNLFKSPSEEFTGENSPLDPQTGTATSLLPTPQEISDSYNTTVTGSTDLSPEELVEKYSAAELQEMGIDSSQAASSNTNSSQTQTQSASEEPRETGTSGSRDYRNQGTRENRARERSRQQIPVTYQPTFEVDFSRLERKIDRSLKKLERRVSDLESQIESIGRRA